jgi:hypothetical protein
MAFIARARASCLAGEPRNAIAYLRGTLDALRAPPAEASIE